MSDNPFRPYTPEEMKQFTDGIFGPITDLILSSITKEGGNMVVSKNEYDKLQIDLINARKRINEMEGTIKELAKQRDTAVQQRDAAQSIRTISRGENDALLRDNERLRRDLTNTQAKLRDAEKRAASARGMQQHPDPRYNKLLKDYTAACNQRDSHMQTIAKLNAELATLKAGTSVEVPHVVVDGLSWNADEIRKLRNTSVSRAAKIQELEQRLDAATSGIDCIKVDAFHYNASDIKGLLNTIDQLRRQNENLKKSKPTIEVKGKYMTISQIEGLMERNLKYAAEIDRLNAMQKRVASTLRGTTTSVKRERQKRRDMEEELKTLRACKKYVDAQDSMLSAENRAASYQDQMNQWRTKFVASDNEVRRLKRKNSEFEAQVKALQNEVERLRGSRTGPATVEVEPTIVELIIRKPEGTYVTVGNIRVAADMIPNMSNSLVQLSTEVQDLRKIIEDKDSIIANKDTIIEHKNAEIADRGRRLENQATTIRAGEERVNTLTRRIGDLTQELAEKTQKLQTKDIELRLVRGQLNSIRRVNKEEPKYEVSIQSGRSCMTTDVGLVSIDSEGMRYLADQYHRLRIKVEQLTTFLEQWATN